MQIWCGTINVRKFLKGGLKIMGKNNKITFGGFSWYEDERGHHLGLTRGKDGKETFVELKTGEKVPVTRILSNDQKCVYEVIEGTNNALYSSVNALAINLEEHIYSSLGLKGKLIQYNIYKALLKDRFSVKDIIGLQDDINKLDEMLKSKKLAERENAEKRKQLKDDYLDSLFKD